MKFVTHTWGSVFLHGSADDVCPAQGLLQSDLIAFVSDAYSFAVKPTFPAGVQSPTLAFRSGKLVKENETYPIQQMMMFPNGDAITASSTDIAEIVMGDFTRRLDEGLGYKYGDKKWKRSYASGVVVEFDEALEDRIKPLKKIEAILNRKMPREGKPFLPKTIVFGYGDPLPNIAMGTMDAAEKADFILQRRPGVPYSENRYFSSAPLQSSDHLKMLEEIERALLE